MKTLVIHPKDKSTDFLRPIYANLNNVTLVTEGWSQDRIKKAIQTHDQVMMMGHGSPSGLFSVECFPPSYPFSNYVIGADMVEVLSQKDNNIFIWCNADRFVEKYDLKGFYSGMFISEVSEAIYCGLEPPRQESVNESNDFFASMLGECLLTSRAPEKIHSHILEHYGMVAGMNDVAAYNHQRLYLK